MSSGSDSAFPIDKYEILGRAAVKIQSLFRGYLYRYRRSRLDIENWAARKIQHAWHAHIQRQKVQRVKELLARKRIGRSIAFLQMRNGYSREMRDLSKFDPILSFYPTMSKPPSPQKFTRSLASCYHPDGTPKKPTSRRGRRKAVPAAETVVEKPKRRVAKRKLADPMTAKTPRAAKEKRKVIVELPPPWHDKNPRRIPQSQIDDMLYDEKVTYNWARSELISLLFNRCSRDLDDRDDLTIRNDRFRNRTVKKMFLVPFQRSSKPLKTTTLKDICLIKVRVFTSPPQARQ
jgi:hypothetical protein